jgi:hypothetical protein
MGCTQELIRADAALREVETEMLFLMEDGEALQAEIAADFEEQQALAASVRRKEENAAKGYVKQYKRAEQQREQNAAAAEQLQLTRSRYGF